MELVIHHLCKQIELELVQVEVTKIIDPWEIL